MRLAVWTLLLTAACSGSGTASPAAPLSDAGGAALASDASADASTSCGPGPSTGDFPCNVGAVIKARCQPCHQDPPQNGAHFPLLSYEDTRQPFNPQRLRFQRMAQVIEPDFLPHMPPHGATQPNAAELTTLRAWFAGCALPTSEGKGCDSRTP